ncbi:MAG: PilZ domain-containing protein [Parvularculaceae bacterium]|nr:PilZ domain-containing protein [Parvularculaceae bacterium]
MPRSEERKPTYKIGKVRTPQSEIQCVVLDMSLSGAKVKLAGAIILAPEVTLVIPDLAYKKKCEVRWQDGDCAGLRTAPPPIVR